ncbi:MAG: hypothetical protein LBC81_06300 [Tannerellaceae bacterium]|jgi:hypothetical protein|nr:hypothetical protein [Tannerellaceae bacterium]
MKAKSVKHLFLFAVMIAGCISAFLSCDSAGSEIPYGPDSRLFFDRNDLVFESSAVTDFIQVQRLHGDDLVTAGYWGASFAEIKTEEGLDTLYNTTILESDGRNIYTVLVSPFAGEWFEIGKENGKRGGNIIIKLKENTGGERSLKIGISTGPQNGEIRLSQKGK